MRSAVLSPCFSSQRGATRLVKAAIAKYVKTIPGLYFAYVNARDIYSYVRYRRAGSFSQHGEDRFLIEWFGREYEGFYVDIGASHPFRISNTYGLYRLGWKGVVVDPIPLFRSLYRLWRRRDVFVNAGVGETGGTFAYFELTPSVLSTFDAAYKDRLIAEGKAVLQRTYDVDIIPINTLLERHVGARTIDFMSLDVEGLDVSIIRSLDFGRFRPRVISVEFNSDDDRDTLAGMLSAAGYDCSRTIGCNLFAIEAREVAARAH